MWRFVEKYIVMFLIPPIGIFALGYFTSKNINRTILFSIALGLLVCVSEWAMRFERAHIWILDDEITYRFSNSYTHLKFKDIENYRIEHVSDKNGNVDLISIVLKTGERYSIGLNSKIIHNKLSKYLAENIKVSN